jgi:hypothetical protein
MIRDALIATVIASVDDPHDEDDYWTLGDAIRKR